MYRTSSSFTPTFTPKEDVPSSAVTMGVFNNGEIIFEKFVDGAGFGVLGTFYYVFRETLEDWHKRHPLPND